MWGPAGAECSGLSSSPGALLRNQEKLGENAGLLSPGTAALAAQGGTDAGVGEQENGGLGMAAGRTGCRNTPESPLGEAVTGGWGVGRGLVGASQEP